MISQLPPTHLHKIQLCLRRTSFVTSSQPPFDFLLAENNATWRITFPKHLFSHNFSFLNFIWLCFFGSYSNITLSKSFSLFKELLRRCYSLEKGRFPFRLNIDKDLTTFELWHIDMVWHVMTKKEFFIRFLVKLFSLLSRFSVRVHYKPSSRQKLWWKNSLKIWKCWWLLYCRQQQQRRLVGWAMKCFFTFIFSIPLGAVLTFLSDACWCHKSNNEHTNFSFVIFYFCSLPSVLIVLGSYNSVILTMTVYSCVVLKTKHRQTCFFHFHPLLQSAMP